MAWVKQAVHVAADGHMSPCTFTWLHAVCHVTSAHIKRSIYVCCSHSSWFASMFWVPVAIQNLPHASVTIIRSQAC